MTQFPQINLNGTDGKVLFDEHLTATNAVQAAIKAVEAITVHGRDYHLISSTATSEAMNEHASRLARLLTVRDELLAISIDIDEQNHKRTRTA